MTCVWNCGKRGSGGISGRAAATIWEANGITNFVRISHSCGSFNNDQSICSGSGGYSPFLTFSSNFRKIDWILAPE